MSGINAAVWLVVIGFFVAMFSTFVLTENKRNGSIGLAVAAICAAPLLIKLWVAVLFA